jgi:hypothetical protein
MAGSGQILMARMPVAGRPMFSHTEDFLECIIQC